MPGARVLSHRARAKEKKSKPPFEVCARLNRPRAAASSESLVGCTSVYHRHSQRHCTHTRRLDPDLHRSTATIHVRARTYSTVRRGTNHRGSYASNTHPHLAFPRACSAIRPPPLEREKGSCALVCQLFHSNRFLSHHHHSPCSPSVHAASAFIRDAACHWRRSTRTTARVRRLRSLCARRCAGSRSTHAWVAPGALAMDHASIHLAEDRGPLRNGCRSNCRSSVREPRGWAL